MFGVFFVVGFVGLGFFSINSDHFRLGVVIVSQFRDPKGCSVHGYVSTRKLLSSELKSELLVLWLVQPNSHEHYWCTECL